MMKSTETGKYRYRPVLFFVLTYLFTWIFWIPAAFVPEETGALLMVLGLLAPAAISTVFVLRSGSKALKQDLKNKLVGFYKVKWSNVFLAAGAFAVIVACSILLASVIEEVGWKGYCEDSIGNYMNWFWESMVFGLIWSFWHFPLIFIRGTYQAGLTVNPLYVINFFISGIPLGFIITWVYLASDRSILACMVFHLFVNFLQEKIAMTPETKCVETLVVTAATVIIVARNREMFFETRHVGRLLDDVSGEGKTEA